MKPRTANSIATLAFSRAFNWSAIQTKNLQILKVTDLVLYFHRRLKMSHLTQSFQIEIQIMIIILNEIPI